MGLLDSFFLGVASGQLRDVLAKLDEVNTKLDNAGSGSCSDGGYGEFDSRRVIDPRFGVTLGDWKRNFQRGGAFIRDAQGNIKGVVFGAQRITEDEAYDLA